ncbi:MAG: chalcone isomerase family protein [Limnohabitans sp.]
MRRPALLAWCLSTVMLMQTAQGAQALDARSDLQALPGALPTAPVRMTYWGFDLYDARLWTLQGFEPQRLPAHPFALELQYLRRLEGPAIARRSIEEMRRIGTFNDAQAQRWLARLRELFPDVRAGDRLTGIHKPGEGAEFWFNGQRRGELADARFAELFFGIGLHPETSAPDVRERLLRDLRR